MVELIYASAATVPFSRADLAALLAKSRARNEREGLTGVLLFHEGSFLQVLEGEEAAVQASFERIQKDPRHAQVLLLKRGPIAARTFGEWRMGFLEAGAAAPPLLEGFTDFLRSGVLGLERSQDAVGRVLSAFRQGRYRPLIK